MIMMTSYPKEDYLYPFNWLDTLEKPEIAVVGAVDFMRELQDSLYYGEIQNQSYVQVKEDLSNLTDTLNPLLEQICVKC